jgi:uncharacterized cupin superfamily protein
MPAQIITFAEPVHAEQSAPAADRLLEGQPTQSISNYFADPTAQFFAGRWASTRGKWRVRYSENEFCHMIQGLVRITALDGRVHQFSAGDSFVVPAGFEGTWEVVEDCVKLYAIFEAAAPR